MKIYFNPYPGAVKNEQEGVRCIVDGADAFIRMKKDLQSISLVGSFADNSAHPQRCINEYQVHGDLQG
ncbi:MAG: hypothetical protein LBF75_00770 [Treponema sp.]|jgi:hypothetical protein|nr:hypothetical protein [Treponema sp.]